MINLPVIDTDKIVLDVNELPEVTQVNLNDYLVVYQTGSPSGHRKIAIHSFLNTILPYNTTYNIFDGLNNFLVRSSLLNVTDGPQGTFSCWVKFSDQGRQHILRGQGNTPGNGGPVRGFVIENEPNPNEPLNVRLTSSTDTLFDSGDILPIIDDNEPHHLLVSWNLTGSPATVLIYIDDELATFTPTTNPIAGNVNYTAASWSIGSDNSGNFLYEGGLADLYFHDEFIDISIETNRRKFISAQGCPVHLGNNGEFPTGTTPLVIFNNFEKWSDGINAGTGGNFTSNGSFIDGESVC